MEILLKSLTMFRLTIVLALLGLSLAVSAKNTRVVNGEDVTIEEAPYQCAIEILGEQTCGCAIIGPKIILTAAHCIKGIVETSLKVRVGSKDRQKGGQLVPVSGLLVHPLQVTLDYDIGIIQLPVPLTFGPTVNAIPIPAENEEVEAGAEGYVTGWGFNKEAALGGKPSATLKGATVPIPSKFTCKAVHPNFTDRMICAGGPLGGYGPCNGDWGGPLVVKGKLVGIASWGIGCARPNFPAVYQSVAKHIAFITEHIKA